MKRTILLCVCTLLLGIWLSRDMWARGGRGGGAATVGGGYRGGPGVAGRTPAMLRPSFASSGARPNFGSSVNVPRTPSARPSYGNLPTPSANRSGSMSNRSRYSGSPNLPSTRPSFGTAPNFGSLPSAGSLPAGGGRVANRDRPNFVNLPSLGDSDFKFGPSSPDFAAFAGGALAGGAAAQFLHDSPAKFPDITLPHSGQLAAAVANSPNKSDNRSDRAQAKASDKRPANDRPNAQDTRAAQAIKGELANSQPKPIDDGRWDQWRMRRLATVSKFMENYCGDCDDWYGNEWWNNLHIDQPYVPDFNPWGSVTWPTMASAMQNGSATPIPYLYGDNVYYQNGSVFYGDKAVASEEDYIKQAEAIAACAPETKPDKKDWTPIGVFALSTNGEPEDLEPNFFIQLAVSKQGILSGTLHNVSAKTTQPIEGMVDKQTQRAAWTVVDKPRPIMETGAANLTQDSSSALVHFADGTTQKCLLVRVEKPASQKKAAAKE